MPRMTKKETRVNAVEYEGRTGLDLRTWRKYEGVRDWRPGKGLFLTYTTPEDLREQAAALIASIEKAVRKAEAAA